MTNPYPHPHPSPLPQAGEGIRPSKLQKRGQGTFVEKPVKLARKLRRNMTEVEKRLWYQFRNRRFQNYKIRRQYPIAGYIADFVCIEAKLVIELDGGQHLEQQARDTKRESAMLKEGFKTMRFWNNEIFENLEGVLFTVEQALKNGMALDDGLDVNTRTVESPLPLAGEG